MKKFFTRKELPGLPSGTEVNVRDQAGDWAIDTLNENVDTVAYVSKSEYSTWIEERGEDKCKCEIPKKSAFLL